MLSNRYVIVTLVLVVVATVANSTALAQEMRPYCGIHSLYAAARQLQKDVRIESLVQPKYVSTRRGSTMLDLKTAATDHGLYAEIMYGMTLGTLRSAGLPVILHVRGSEISPKYDHWVLCLGTDKTDFVILDAPNPVGKVTPAWLLAHWDGTGLVVSNRPIATSMLAASDHVVALSLCVLAACAVGFLRWGQNLVGSSRIGTSRPGHRWSGAWGLVALPLVAAVLAIAQNAFAEDGLIRNRDVRRVIQAANVGRFLPSVDAETLRARLQSPMPDLLLIDARLTVDFEAGHIPGAISLPVTSSDASRRQILQGRPRTVPIVLYCQSLKCDFDTQVAAWLWAEGYRNIEVFNGGWLEWQKQ